LILRTPIFIMWSINDQKVAIVIFPSLRMGPESTLRLSAFLDESQLQTYCKCDHTPAAS